MKLSAISILLIIYTVQAWSQPTFTARVDSMSMLMGDQQYFTLTLKSNNNTPVADFHIETLDTCSFMDILSQSLWVKTQENNSTTQEKKIKFAIFDEGNYWIPSLYAVVGNDTLYTYPIPIQVQGVEPDSTGLLPIKGIVRETSKWTDYLFWIIALLGVLIGYMIYRYIQHKKKLKHIHVIKVPEKIILPHEIALIKLRALQKSKLWMTGEIKEYHVQLTFILREYLEHRYDIPALESTSIEILKDLKAQQLTTEQITIANDILHIADWVKFAKGLPEEDANNQAIERAIALVQDTQPEVPSISNESNTPQ